tara:strand:+ start:581 stop:856 length:276 start_codon:yes stop_codon:yes gene_type:complete
MDKRKKNGGKREGAGRPPKADEAKLIERLDNIIDSDSVIKELHKLVSTGDFRAIQLYFQYRWGKPKESVDVTTNGDSLEPNQIVFFKTDED